MGYWKSLFEHKKRSLDESGHIHTTELISIDEDRIRKLEKTVDNLTKLLDYSNGYSDNRYILWFGNEPSPSIKFPGGIVRTIKKLEASEEIKDTKPKKSKAKK